MEQWLREHSRNDYTNLRSIPCDSQILVLLMILHVSLYLMIGTYYWYLLRGFIQQEMETDTGNQIQTLGRVARLFGKTGRQECQQSQLTWSHGVPQNLGHPMGRRQEFDLHPLHICSKYEAG